MLAWNASAAFKPALTSRKVGFSAPDPATGSVVAIPPACIILRRLDCLFETWLGPPKTPRRLVPWHRHEAELSPGRSDHRSLAATKGRERCRALWHPPVVFQRKGVCDDDGALPLKPLYHCLRNWFPEMASVPSRLKPDGAQFQDVAIAENGPIAVFPKRTVSNGVEN